MRPGNASGGKGFYFGMCFRRRKGEVIDVSLETPENTLQMARDLLARRVGVSYSDQYTERGLFQRRS
jgi:hypothetical protein